MSFIKSHDTRSPVANSRSEIERILRRYGAVGFNVQQTFSDNRLPDMVTIQFIVPDKPGSKARVPVSLPISVKNVYHALYGEPKKWQGGRRAHDPLGYNVKRMEQAERVAWRNLVLWIDAALSAASVGLQTITEAFYAHAVVALADGTRARLSEVVEQAQGQLPYGVRALLESPADAEVSA